VSLRIVFMGTPGVAAPSFRALAAAGHDLMAVCQPDRERGRGRKVASPAMKDCAAEAAVSVLQPQSVNSPEALEAIVDFAPDLYCVVAFGQILKPETLSVPRLGAVNLHFSLLPRWRGAAPVEHAIWAGDQVTGVTTQFMAVGLDEGDVILQHEVPMVPYEIAGELLDRLADIGSGTLIRTVELICRGEAPRTPQDHSRATFAPRLRPEQGLLDLSSKASAIANHVRAFNPRPGCFVVCPDGPLKVWRAEPGPGADAEPGTVLGVEGDALLLAAGHGAVALTRVQPAGRGVQTGRDYANGQRMRAGDRLVRQDSRAPLP